MFSIFPSNKKCRLEHVVNKLMSCLINEFLWILIQTAGNKYQTSLILHATPWNSIKFYGTSSILQGTAWNSMECHGYSMELNGSSKDFYGSPWISVEFHGIRWRYFTWEPQISLALNDSPA